jgi:tetratricopeptide (TPR) repeat protein
MDILVQRDPVEALGVANGRRRDPDRSAASRAVDEWAAGRAELELGDAEQAVASLRRAVELGTHGAVGERADRSVVARFRISLALALAEVGRTAAALAQLRTAAPDVDDDGRPRLLAQRSLVLLHAGRLREAEEAAGGAIVAAVANGDRLTEARSLVNRGIVRLQAGRLAPAETDLRAAAALADVLDQRLMAAAVLHDLALVYARRGEIPRALEAFADAAGRLDQLASPGRTLVNLERDRAECLLLAGLSEEAAESAARAEALAASYGSAVAEADAALLLAAALLRTEATGEALAAAERARTAFQRARRPGWTAYAQYVALRVRSADTTTPVDPEDRKRARVVVRRLTETGWTTEADQALVMLALLELRAGELRRARRLLDRVPSARRRGPVADRVQAWYAEAELRAVTGDRTGARRAVRTGMRIVEEHADALGAAELQASAAAHGSDLAALGTALALASGRPADVLTWADRWRAWTLARPPTRPGPDAARARAIGDIRTLSVELRDADPGSRQFVSLRRRLRAAEHELRDRSRTGSGPGLGGPGGLRAADVAARLDGRILVELLESDGVLHAVVGGAGRPLSLRTLGSADTAGAVASLTAALMRLARPNGERWLGAADDAAAALDERLLRPLDLSPDARLVIVPSRSLHGVPWRALPSLAGRPVTIAPSAAMGLRAVAPRTGLTTRGFVAGPGLPGAAQEVERLAADHSGQALVGAAATVDACLDLAGAVSVLHVAAHGSLRVDNPAFSSLELADGPLTVYDLDQLHAVPDLVVLPACDVARAGQIGDELVGVAHTLLGQGVRAVIAPVLPVPDRATARLMCAVHRHLAEGDDPASALAAAGAAPDLDDPADRLAAAAFVCLGSDAAYTEPTPA